MATVHFLTLTRLQEEVLRPIFHRAVMRWDCAMHHRGNVKPSRGCASCWPEGVVVANPAFDITPHRYISAIITERGIVREPYGEGLGKII